jgi:hypothetical protein
MKSVPLRVQLLLVAAGYVGVLAIAALLVYERHMQYVNHPEEAAGGGRDVSRRRLDSGDLHRLHVACPNVFSGAGDPQFRSPLHPVFQILLGLSLTAPLCLAVLSIPAVGRETINRGTMLLGEICLDRLFASPLVVVGLVFSRLLARFDRAKRLTLCGVSRGPHVGFHDRTVSIFGESPSGLGARHLFRCQHPPSRDETWGIHLASVTHRLQTLEDNQPHVYTL